MTTSSPDDKSTGTIKFGKGYEDPWFVASGNPTSIRRQILEFAGLKDDPEKTLQQLMIEVATETQAMWALRSKGGAQRLPASKSAKAKAPADDASVAEPAAPAQEEEAEAADPNAFIFEAISDADSVDALKRVFAKNKDAFTANKALQTAFVERKNALA
jgi:hypothetical protein